jgi:hypothetical protein
MTQIVVAMRSSWLFCFVLFCWELIAQNLWDKPHVKPPKWKINHANITVISHDNDLDVVNGHTKWLWAKENLMLWYFLDNMEIELVPRIVSQHNYLCTTRYQFGPCRNKHLVLASTLVFGPRQSNLPLCYWCNNDQP